MREKEVYVFLAMMSSVLEVATTFRYDLTKEQKYAVNLVCDNLSRIERNFKRAGVTDNENYDKIVEIFNETYSMVLDSITEKP